MRLKLMLLVMVVIAGLVPFTLAHSQDCTYAVQSGDSLAKIADQYGLEVWELQEMNDDLYPSIWNGTLQAGWVLRVPCAGGETPVPTPAPGAITATPNYSMNMRAGAGTTYAVVGKAAGGLPVTLEARNAESNWVLGTTLSGQRGWLAAWLVSIDGTVESLPISTEVMGSSNNDTPVPPTAEPPSDGVTGSAKGSMNMRAGPSTSHKVVGRAISGVAMPLEARNAASNWVLGTNSSGQRGWMAAWLMTINGSVASLPVSTEIIGSAPSGPAPTAAPPVAYTGQYSNFITERVKDIYKKGLARGNYAGRFTKIGDSETDNPFFLTQYDSGDYYLADYGYLSPMLTTFKGSFTHKSLGAKGGFVVDSLLDPLWANPQLCRKNESSVECEYRTWRPSIALILVRTYPNPEYQAKFEENVRKVIDLTLKYNIIPVLSTVPYLPPGGWQYDMNNTIRKLSAEYQIPLWDLYETTSIMPSNGVDYSTAHLSIPPDGSACNLSQPNLSTYGTVRRNLEALEVLHYITTIRK